MFLVSRVFRRGSIYSVKAGTRLSAGHIRGYAHGEDLRPDLSVFRASSAVAAASTLATIQPPPDRTRRLAIICLLAVGLCVSNFFTSEARFLWTQLETVEVTGRRRYAGSPGQTDLEYPAPLVKLRLKTVTAMKGHTIATSRNDEGLRPQDPVLGHAQRVLDKLAKAVGLSIELELIDDPTDCRCIAADRTCLQAGAGLLAILNNEAELAAALSHAVAQILAGHLREVRDRELLDIRLQEGMEGIMSKMLRYVGIGMQCFGLMMSTVDVPAGIAFLACGTSFGLPRKAIRRSHSRNATARETEADYLGMLLMAEAGYDPEAMVTYWRELGLRRSRLHHSLLRRYGGTRVAALKDWPEVRTWTSGRTADGIEKAALVREIVVAAKVSPEAIVFSARLREPANIDLLFRWTTFKDGLDSQPAVSSVRS